MKYLKRNPSVVMLPFITFLVLFVFQDLVQLVKRSDIAFVLLLSAVCYALGWWSRSVSDKNAQSSTDEQIKM